MSQKLQPVRGTHDLLPADAVRFRYITTQALGVAARYGYGEIATPIFEFSDVFHRTLGDTSDVVTKETYSFTDRGGESLTLRPEFTASIARAFISNGLQDQLPLKFFYSGPAFRYERPQKGRQRQFHQIGAELLGVDSPHGDVETIALAYQVLAALGLTGKVKLELNTLGDKESRVNYRNALVGYFTAHAASLCEESRIRLEKNPLRILDSKDEGDRAIIAGAPRLQLYLTVEAQRYFKHVQEGLGKLGISFALNERLVRGLDYYNHTVFEFTTDQLGAQGTVLAGGRYDGLIELMGGPPTPGIGWAAGIERLAALLPTEDVAPLPRPITLIPVGDEFQGEALGLAVTLRGQGFTVDMAFKGNLSNRMKKAARNHSSVVVLVGGDAWERNKVEIKRMDTQEQSEVDYGQLTNALAPYKDNR